MANVGQKYGISGSVGNWAFTGNVYGASYYGPGKVLYVDTTVGGSGDGKSWSGAYLTMAEALAAATDSSVIFFRGKVREQLVAPLGVQGVKIIGAVGGNVRDDDGAKWYAPASPVAGKALIEILEQGWEFHNFLMTPDNTGGAAIKAHRNEDATYPDSSHFIVRNMRFVGGGGTPIGIEDVGGNHHYIIEDSEFQSLTKAITCSSTAIAIPTRNTIRRNKFMQNTMDVASSQSYSLIEKNRFFTAGSGATNKVVSTTFNAVQGGNNQVVLNTFMNTEAQIAPGSGYTGAASDLWANYVNDQAALAIGLPA